MSWSGMHDKPLSTSLVSFGICHNELVERVLMQAEHNIKGCYNLKSLQPVDMFPHTPHIECVCLLELCEHSS